MCYSKKSFLIVLSLIFLGVTTSCNKEVIETDFSTSKSVTSKNQDLSFDKVCNDLIERGAVEISKLNRKSKSSTGFSNYSGFKVFEMNNQTYEIYGWDSNDNAYYRAASNTCNKLYSDITEEDGTSHKICSGDGTECRVESNGDETGITIVVCAEAPAARP